MAKLMPSLRRSHQSLSISNMFNTTKQNPSLFTTRNRVSFLESIVERSNTSFNTPLLNRAMDLHGEVMACGYEDVQVMWSTLDKSKSAACTNITST
ncbi:hypothetical protein Q3G72_032923 [Acer saccharum]|nr:hypothetical protein Q3G72_019310 [Acer saccharum]KAK1584421.1 hypothetical protein Q3G72_032923 [Acer saccharum]